MFSLPSVCTNFVYLTCLVLFYTKSFSKLTLTLYLKLFIQKLVRLQYKINHCFTKRVIDRLLNKLILILNVLYLLLKLIKEFIWLCKCTSRHFVFDQKAKFPLIYTSNDQTFIYDFLLIKMQTFISIHKESAAIFTSF